MYSFRTPNHLTTKSPAAAVPCRQQCNPPLAPPASSQLTSRSEFAPQRQQQQQSNQCQSDQQQQQQKYSHQPLDNQPTSAGVPCFTPQLLNHLYHQHHHQAVTISSSVADQHQQQQPMTQSELANTSSSSQQSASQRQYFMRSSLNESIKMRRSQRRTSNRRSSQRSRRLASAGIGGPLRRQVRFQPIPQAINISAYSSSSEGSSANNDADEDDATNESSILSGLDVMPPFTAGDSKSQTVLGRAGLSTETTLTNSTTTTFIKSRHRINIKRMQQQLTRLGRKSRITSVGHHVRAPKFSSKPFQQLNHHIRPSFAAFGGKIKSFASHLQQSLGSSGGSHSIQPQCTTYQSHTPTQQQLPGGTPKLLPLQKTFHLRNSAASAKHQITLTSAGLSQIGNGDQQPQQKKLIAAPLFAAVQSSAVQSSELTSNQAGNKQQVPTADPLDDGWGSDFDETQSNADASAVNNTTTCSSNANTSGGCYLLEIGKSSCDTRAVDDVIQDQGICGQFKRLHDVSLLDIPFKSVVSVCSSAEEQAVSDKQQRQEQRLEAIRDGLQRVNLGNCGDGDAREVQLEDDAQKVVEGEEDTQEEEEEEDELRSLEARQGYRQVRDKLKLILDQRLASFERDLSGASANPVPQGARQEATSASAGIQRPRDNSSEEAAQQQQQRAAAALMRVEVQVDHFDCQSNCSEASSLSSGGLDSNHSGSQDSGHSTQHSGYSAINHHRHQRDHREHLSSSSGSKGVSATTASSCTNTSKPLSTSDAETSPTNQLGSSSNCDSGASTCGDELLISSSRSSPPIVQHVSTPSPLSSTPKQATKAQQQVPRKQQEQTSSPECEERRNRFIQNRLIINSKLESMFKSRTSSAQGPTAAADKSKCAPRTPLIHQQPQHEVDDSPTKSIQSCPTPATDHGRQSRLMASYASEPSIRATGAPLDPSTRLKLLEQQRQMSLKLKQKPRRRTAKRALNLTTNDSTSPYQNHPMSSASSSISAASCNASLDNQSITTLTNEEETQQVAFNSSYYQQQQQQPVKQSSGGLVRSGSKRCAGGSKSTRWTAAAPLSQDRDNLTKQLSMVCLRQLERSSCAPALDEHSKDDATATTTSGCGGGTFTSAQKHQLQQVAAAPRPAMSLRQLVKETIDDCEQPSKLSTLTRNILNRSDSLSSSGERLC